MKITLFNEQKIPKPVLCATQPSYQFWCLDISLSTDRPTQVLSDASLDLATLTFLTFEATALVVLRLCTKFELCRPSCSEDIAHLH